MEVVCVSKMSVNFCQTHHIQEGSTIWSHWCEKLWSHVITESEVLSNMDHISKHMKENYRSELGEGKYQLMGIVAWRKRCFAANVEWEWFIGGHAISFVCKITVFTIVIYSWELCLLTFKHIWQMKPLTLIKVHSPWWWVSKSINYFS